MRLKAALPTFLLAATPTLADEYFGFRSPTGNIHCAMHTFDGRSGARCDLRSYTPSYSKRPAGCEQDWGMAFGVGAAGKGELLCVGDTVQDPGNPVLPYGEALSLGGISCVSAKTGMTCSNAEGHGFSVAKAKRTLF